MSRKIIFSLAAFTAISFTVFTACNQQESGDRQDSEMNENASQNETTESAATLETLKSELKDVGKEIEELTVQESAEFKTDAEAVITRLNSKITAFENEAHAAGHEFSESTRIAIDNLEQKAVKIESKLRVMGETTEEKAGEFTEELRHDFNDLGESLKNFFEDNA